MLDTAEATASTDEAPAAQEYQPGELAPSIVTDAKVWKPDDFKDKTLVSVIKGLFERCSLTDEAARRFNVLETWELRHFDRQHQYLRSDGNGGWKIFGSDAAGKNTNGLETADDHNLYATNVFSAQGDIATGSLNRGKIEVSFQPRRSKNPPDVAASDEADKYKWIWQKVNPDLQSDFFNAGWTDCRTLTWTRSVADARWGDENGPARRELSTVHGVLETKGPMMADKLSQWGYAQVFEEVDYAIARATYPWMGKKIKPSWGGAGELEFERIARINTRIGIVGKYITGTSGMRETTMGYSWFRPGMYFDDSVQDAQKDFLLQNFPTGLFCVFSGTDLCCCWDESMDDHLALGMYTRGYGQSRRALGSTDLPIQKRINIWADLWDKFVRSAIPITLLESKAFDSEAINQLESDPRRFVEVALDEGQGMQDVVGQTPAPVPIPGMSEMLQWYCGPLIQALDGATPAIYGGGDGTGDTWRGQALRIQQALERFGPVWRTGNRVISKACEQAAKCCGRTGTEELSDSVQGKDISVRPSLLRGNFEAFCPETDAAIPESGAQRQDKIIQMMEMSASNPALAAVTQTPSNAREIIKGLGLGDVITIDEANAEDGALEDIETLLDSEPLANPDFAALTQQVQELTQAHEQAKAMATQMLASGQPPPPQAIQAGQQMSDQLDQLTQQLQQTPQFLPYVPVSQKDDQDHATIKATVFAWMQDGDGRSLRRLSQRDPMAAKKWLNVSLYYDGHSAMAAKFQQPAQTQPKVNITGKLSPEQQAQILGMTGVQTDPKSLDETHVSEQTTRVYTPVSEVETTIKGKP